MKNYLQLIFILIFFLLNNNKSFSQTVELKNSIVVYIGNLKISAEELKNGVEVQI